MNNKKAIRCLCAAARNANHMAQHYARMRMNNKANEWRNIRQHHMATARQLKQDAQQ